MADVDGVLPFWEEIEFPDRDNHLRPNGQGGYIIRQSDISSWAYCQLRKFYEDSARRDPNADQPARLSATQFGSVVHFAVMQMEKAHHEGREDALQVGLTTFEYYWHPENIGAITEPVNEWLPRDTYGGLRERGQSLLRTYYGVFTKDDSYLLGLEYEFAVPMTVNGRLHTLTGTVDRLSIRRHHLKPYISVDDLKTGKRPFYLRYNTQGGFYAYATTLPEFWTGWPDSGCEALDTFGDELIGSLDDRFASWGYKLHRGSHWELPLASRRFRWIDLKDIKFVDGGWRVEQDYGRLALAVDAYVSACEAGVYAVNTVGEVCRYCSFRNTCAGVGLPRESIGAP